MRRRTLTGWFLALTAGASLAAAQGPGGFGRRSSETPEEFAARMLAFDKDGDGKLAKDELTDARLHRLFDRADADGDGVATKDELTALATKEQAEEPRGGPGFGPGGPGGPGGPMMGLPRPGEVLPAGLRRELNLTDEQAKQIDSLQKEVDDRLAKILDEDQRQTLQSLRERRAPGGRGFGPDGPPPGGPGGPPPGGARGDR